MKNIKILAFIIMALALSELKAQMINTDSVYKTYNLGFSQAVVANGIVYTSGIVGWDNNYKLIGSGNFEEQANQCFKNLKLLLTNSNSKMGGIIHLRLFVTEISEGNKSIISNLLKIYFPNNYKPATTLLCVKALARENLKIEIESVSNINK